MNTKKRKGFTLVELIAVIAILGILAIIIVPTVSSKTKSAEAAKNLVNLKTIAQAVEMYNAENTLTKIENTTTIADIEAYLMPTEAGKTKYLSAWPSSFGSLTISTYEDIITNLPQ